MRARRGRVGSARPDVARRRDRGAREVHGTTEPGLDLGRSRRHAVRLYADHVAECGRTPTVPARSRVMGRAPFVRSGVVTRAAFARSPAGSGAGLGPPGIVGSDRGIGGRARVVAARVHGTRSSGRRRVVLRLLRRLRRPRIVARRGRRRACAGDERERKATQDEQRRRRSHGPPAGQTSNHCRDPVKRRAPGHEVRKARTASAQRTFVDPTPLSTPGPPRPYSPADQ